LVSPQPSPPSERAAFSLAKKRRLPFFREVFSQRETEKRRLLFGREDFSPARKSTLRRFAIGLRS